MWKITTDNSWLNLLFTWLSFSTLVIAVWNEIALCRDAILNAAFSCVIKKSYPSLNIFISIRSTTVVIDIISRHSNEWMKEVMIINSLYGQGGKGGRTWIKKKKYSHTHTRARSYTLPWIAILNKHIIASIGKRKRFCEIK